MVNRSPLSQEEVDRIFRNSATGSAAADVPAAIPFDYGRRDRVGKDRLQAVRFIHTTFAKSAALSLSTYLRTFAVVNLISVEQLPFRDYAYSVSERNSFLKISMQPCGCRAVLEISSAVALQAVETLLGGAGRQAPTPARELTEIEQSILDGLYRVLLQDLQNAWAQVAPMALLSNGHESQPRLAQVLSPAEPVVSASLEVQLSNVSGVMNFVFPTLALSLLQQNLGKNATSHRGDPSEEQQERIVRLLQPSLVRVEARLDGSTMKTRSLLDLAPGKVLCFDYPACRSITVALNGRPMFSGRLRVRAHKRAVEIANSNAREPGESDSVSRGL